MKIVKNAVCLIVVVSLLVVMLPSPIYALTQDRAIQGEGSQTDGSYFGGSGNYTNLNSDDDATSILIMQVNGTWYHCYEFQDFVTSYAAINGVTLSVKWRRTAYLGNVWITPYVRIGGTNYYGTASTGTTSYVTYTENTFNGVTNKNPVTGNDWTAAEINAAEFGIRLVSNGFDETHTTYMKLTIDYDPLTTPSMTTSAATGISYNGTHNVTLNGEITATGGATVDQRGFCYGTTSNITMPSSGEVPPASYTSNITQVGSYGIGVFSQEITGLVIGTTYYYRAYAHNSQGWAYGNQLSFTTLSNPSITTVAASNIAVTTARLNSSVTSSGGEACTVQFAYARTALGPFANYAAIVAAGTTANAAGTYITGQTPYVDIAGLLAATDYTFMASITNSVSTQYGGQLTFLTESGINAPTNFIGIPTASTVSLQWTKGVGSTNTMIRYKLGNYPTNTADGTQVYFSTQSSVVHSSLTAGTTYYYKAWGESGGTYSTANVTLMITTLAAMPASDVLPTPMTPAQWYQAPDYTTMSNVPFYGMINWWADTFQIPRATLWTMAYIILIPMMGGIFVFAKSQKILIADIVVIILMLLGVFMGLVSMWLIMPFAIIAFAAIAVGERI